MSFARNGRAVPVFNDKHLSWKWEWAKEMVETSRQLNFPFLRRLVARADVADAGR